MHQLNEEHHFIMVLYVLYMLELQEAFLMVEIWSYFSSIIFNIGMYWILPYSCSKFLAQFITISVDRCYFAFSYTVVVSHIHKSWCRWISEALFSADTGNLWSILHEFAYCTDVSLLKRLTTDISMHKWWMSSLSSTHCHSSDWPLNEGNYEAVPHRCRP